MKYICIFLLGLCTVLRAEEDYFQKVQTASSYLMEKTEANPKLLMVLTAGVEGPLLEDAIEVSSSDIPFFPKALAKGHEGKLLFGKLHGVDVVLMKGRYHYYEGLSAQEVVFPYFVLKELGVESVITMNAVGGIRYDLNAGDIMLVTDHINFIGDNSLRGLSVHFPDRQFTDMTNAYDFSYQKLAEMEAEKLGMDLKKGIYVAMPGPNYETRSEIKMLRTFGADAVGMSTALEVIACNFLKMKVLTFCCIANPAADRHEGGMSHEEVLAELNAAGPKLSKLATSCAKEILLR